MFELKIESEVTIQKAVGRVTMTPGYNVLIYSDWYDPADFRNIVFSTTDDGYVTGIGYQGVSLVPGSWCGARVDFDPIKGAIEVDYSSGGLLRFIAKDKLDADDVKQADLIIASTLHPETLVMNDEISFLNNLPSRDDLNKLERTELFSEVDKYLDMLREE